MHTKRVLPLLVALFALAGGTAQAQTAAAPQTAGSVRVSSGNYYHVTAQEAFDIEQQYRMSNGQRLEVRQQDKHFFGRLIDDRELQAKAQRGNLPHRPRPVCQQKGRRPSFSAMQANMW